MIRKTIIKYREIISYIIVGGLTTVVSLVSYYICVLLFLDPADAVQLQVANVLSWICAVIFAYFTNRRFVFEMEKKQNIREATRFFGARVTTLLIDMVSMAVMVSVLGMNDKVAKVLVQFIVLILNYVFSKFFVFIKGEF